VPADSLISSHPKAVRRSFLSRLGDPAGYLLMAPIVILLLGFFYYPVLRSLYMSLFDWPLIGTPKFVGWGNYVRMLGDKVIWQAWGFTIVWTALITPACVILSLLLALLTSNTLRGISFFRSIYFMPTVLTTVAAGLIWKWFFGSQQDGLVNYALQSIGAIDGPIGWLGTVPWNSIAVGVMGLWLWVGLSMVLFIGAIQSIPVELYEAAGIDGASPWQRFTLITLPMLRPTFGLVFIISVIGSFMSFPEFLTMTNGGPGGSTTPILMRIYIVSFKSFKLGYGSALSFVLMLSLVLLTIIQLRLSRDRTAQ
jgi:multiple sugar transport system permease protein